MNDNPEQQAIRKLFSDQARQDRGLAPDFADTLRAARPQPPLAWGRLAIAASLLIFAGILLATAFRTHTTQQQPAPEIALPNLLDGLDTPAETTWQSPTAFLLNFSNVPAGPDSAPSPGNPSQTRQSNG